MITRMFRAFDFYGTKITLSYNGKSNFKTCFGGMLSLITAGLIAFYIFLILTHPVKIVNTSTEEKYTSTVTTSTPDPTPATNSKRIWIINLLRSIRFWELNYIKNSNKIKCFNPLQILTLLYKNDFYYDYK